MPDKYDEEVERLTKLQLEWEKYGNGNIQDSPLWQIWNESESILFEPVDECGNCLTEVRSYRKAESWKLTKMIRMDDRIPFDGAGITIQNLPVFAEWRRKLDEMDRCKD